MTRREFIDAALALIAVPTVASAAGNRAASKVSRRKLGRTGAEISCIGVGGYHIGKQKDPAESIRIIRKKYKTSHHFDGTVHHPEWLGPRAG